MKAYLNTKIEKFIKDYYGLVVILIIDLVLIIIPFLLSNNLEGFDGAGHLANAYYIKEAFWPWPDGWNSMNLSGYPQGFFYPSLFHWLSAALSFAIPLVLSFKLLVSLAIFSLPIIVFLLARKVFIKNQIAIFATIFFSIFYFFEMGVSGNLFSDLFYGMFSHLFSLSLLFLYIYSLSQLITDQRKWRVSGFLLGLTLLAHIISGVVAFLLAATALVLAGHNKVSRSGLIKHLVVGVLIAMCWWLPFISNINYSSGSNASSIAEFFIILAIPFIALLNVFSFKIKSEQALLFRSISVVSSLILIGSLLGNYLNISNLAIHSARFVIYVILLAPLSLTYVYYKSNIKWVAVNFGLVACFFFYIFFLRIIPVGPFETEILEDVQNKWQGGRVIVSGYSKYLDVRFHSTRMKLIMEHNIPVFEGLFVESSVNGWYVMSLIRSWDVTRQNFTWGYIDLEPVTNLSWAAKIFGINYEYRISDDSPVDEKMELIEKVEKLENKEQRTKLSGTYSRETSNLYFKINKQDKKNNTQLMQAIGESRPGFYYQSFNQINNTSLAEALSVRPVSITNNWEESAKKWWTTDWLMATSTTIYNYSKPILVESADVNAWQLVPQDIGLALYDVNQKMNTFVVDASRLKSPAPIYVKVAYFPFWRAYDQFGDELKIYKASPNFILVYGRGIITFRYQKPWYYYGAYLVSGLTLGFLVGSYCLRKRDKSEEI